MRVSHKGFPFFSLPLGEKNELPPGTHQFNFSFLLPNGIPSSFESSTGQVRHCCKAKMDIPWGIDKKAKRPYSVNTLLDLNRDPQAQVSIERLNTWMCRIM